jgi:hypothetical protein
MVAARPSHSLGQVAPPLMSRESRHDGTDREYQHACHLVGHDKHVFERASLDARGCPYLREVNPLEPHSPRWRERLTTFSRPTTGVVRARSARTPRRRSWHIDHWQPSARTDPPPLPGDPDVLRSNTAGRLGRLPSETVTGPTSAVARHLTSTRR